jgi:hypothetical protein
MLVESAWSMILRTDGTPVGTFISSGLAGCSAPRGAPCGLLGEHSCDRWNGDFHGARGTWTTLPPLVFGGPQWRKTRPTAGHSEAGGTPVIYLTPLPRVERVTTAGTSKRFFPGLGAPQWRQNMPHQ